MEWTKRIEGKHTKENCYGCVNYTVGLNKKVKAKANEKKPDYKSVPSAQTPLPFGGSIQHKMPNPELIPEATGNTQTTRETVDHSLYEPSATGQNDPILLTQDRLDYLVAKLELSKLKSEMLASFLKVDRLLAPGTKVTAYRSRQAGYQKNFLCKQ